MNLLTIHHTLVILVCTFVDNSRYSLTHIHFYAYCINWCTVVDAFRFYLQINNNYFFSTVYFPAGDFDHRGYYGTNNNSK